MSPEEPFKLLEECLDTLLARCAAMDRALDRLLADIRSPTPPGVWVHDGGILLRRPRAEDGTLARLMLSGRPTRT